MELSVREMEKEDIEIIVDYFVNADIYFLKSIGADKTKLPNRTEWIKKLNNEFEKTNKKKQYYYIIWMIDNQPTGHSNINKIDFGKTATMHLHLWKSNNRQKGLGPQFLKRTIPYYFNNFKLEKLICEPKSKNIAPNQILKKVGFKFIKEYETVLGMINFLQSVNRYEMTKERFKEIDNGTHLWI
jgi:RimJ/RimL family protein N-acetyltransferase